MVAESTASDTDQSASYTGAEGHNRTSFSGGPPTIVRSLARGRAHGVPAVPYPSAGRVAASRPTLSGEEAVDPNVPNQDPYQNQPGAPVPPPSGQPVPPQWGQPVPPQWGVPAPTKSSGLGGFFRSVAGRIIAIVVVLGILGGAGFIYMKVVNPDHLSQVIFTSTDQTSNDNCQVTNRVSTIKAGDDVYIMVMWSKTMSASDKVVEEDFRDGVSLGTTPMDPSTYGGYDCTVDSTNYGSTFTEPGTYEIKYTVGDQVVADGTLTVTK